MRSKVGPTTRAQLVDARLGQGAFRRDLDRDWGYARAVTGIRQRETLRASLIVPWRPSSDAERLNPNNGLLLVATLDALFDKGLISFANDGSLLVGKISGQDQAKFGLLGKLELRIDAPSALTVERLKFLRRHRKENEFPDA